MLLARMQKFATAITHGTAASDPRRAARSDASPAPPAAAAAAPPHPGSSELLVRAHRRRRRQRRAAYRNHLLQEMLAHDVPRRERLAVASDALLGVDLPV